MIALRRVGVVAGLAALALGSQGCNFAVKHPAGTAAIVGGSLGLVTCELNASDDKTSIGGANIPTCPIVGAGAAALLGLAVLGALYFGTTDEEEDPAQPESQALAVRPRKQPTQPIEEPKPKQPEPVVVPEYLAKTTPEVYVRSGGSIIRAPVEDQNLVRTYPTSLTRGPIKSGQRITILTTKTKYAVGEPVRVLHVMDAPEAGHDLYVMGPKAIHGEFVDGVEKTPPAPPAQSYDGRVVPSPAVDYNYEITSYTFDTPGIHLIQWKLGDLESNVVAVEIAKPAGQSLSP